MKIDHRAVYRWEDLVVVATITPDMPFPSTACLLQHKLGLGRVPCSIWWLLGLGFFMVFNCALPGFLWGGIKKRW